MDERTMLFIGALASLGIIVWLLLGRNEPTPPQPCPVPVPVPVQVKKP